MPLATKRGLLTEKTCNMKDIDKLREVAEGLNLKDIARELETIKMRLDNENAYLVLPLVGEFSSGKTTLINALTDCLNMETATKPTTSTIYEVHFGSDSSWAQVLDAEGNTTVVENVADLKNEDLADSTVVTVFDTSHKVPSSTILVDTPGLSSPDVKHRQTLIDFLPKADGILLVTDINQQITRSLTDFVETLKLSRKPIYLILSKCDTKSETEVASAKRYVSEHCRIPLHQVAAVSAVTDSLDELYALLDGIQHNKNNILKMVDGQRLEEVTETLKQRVDTLLAASASDEGINAAIAQGQREIEKVHTDIDRIVDNVSDELEEKLRAAERAFEDTVQAQLLTLVTGKSDNFDAEAVAIVNSTATLILNDFKADVLSILEHSIRIYKREDAEPYALTSPDLSLAQTLSLSYDLNLNAMGHEYDEWIKNGMIAMAAVGVVAAAASTGGTALGAASTAGAVTKAIDIADTITDVGSIISNRRTLRRMEKVSGFVMATKEKYNTLNQTDLQMGQKLGGGRGLIESAVGLVTDRLMSKPQRVRAVRSYIGNSLAPDFNASLRSASDTLLRSVRQMLQDNAAAKLAGMTDALTRMKREKQENEILFEQRMAQLRAYRRELSCQA